MKQDSKVNIFLIELLIAVMFLSVYSAVCLKLFSAAHMASLESKRLNKAAVLCASAAEVYKSFGGNKSQTADTLGGNYDTKEDTLKVYLDKEFNNCDEQNAVYELYINDFKINSNVTSAKIGVNTYQGSEEIFNMEVGVYSPVEGM